MLPDEVPIKVEIRRGVAVELIFSGFHEARTSSSATLNGSSNLSGDLLEADGPRNPSCEAARGWLQRLVRRIFAVQTILSELQ